MIDKQNIPKIIIGILVIILFFVFKPKLDFSSKSTTSFGVINKSSKATSIPSALKWGNDFNHNYIKEDQKKKRDKKAPSLKDRFNYFKK